MNTFLVESGRNDNVDHLVDDVMKLDGENILQNFDMSIAAFSIRYKEVHALDVYPPVTAAPSAEDRTDGSLFLGANAPLQYTGTSVTANSENNAAAIRTQMLAARVAAGKFDLGGPLHYIKAILCDPWSQYVKQWNANEAHKRLLKFSTETFTEKATVDALEVVDGEIAADKAQLQQLIQKETEKKTSQLTKDLEKLKNQLASLKLAHGGSKKNGNDKRSTSPSKNSPRGRASGASKNKQQRGHSPKRKRTSSPGRQSRGRKRDDSTDGSDNDSTKSQRRRSSSSKGRRSNAGTSRSPKRNNRSSQRSNRK